MFRKDKESYSRFYSILGFYPHNISLYEQALLHKSTAVKSEKGRPLNNERLEFLGDAILDAIVADIVFKQFEGKREGFLTNTRSKIVQRETLNKLAVEIGLDKLIKYSTRTSSHNSYMCGNAFEALIGAIYIDRGYAACKYFMEEKIIKRFIDLEKVARKEVNFKSKLIEWTQKNKVIVSFELIEQFLDKESNPIFQSEVLIEGLSAGTGIGYSKKESQQNAAKMAMKKVQTTPNFLDEVFDAAKKRVEAAVIASAPEETTSINPIGENSNSSETTEYIDGNEDTTECTDKEIATYQTSV
ncbi:ribonuclease 3 [Bacteroides sedimenti]|uniref:Ribonuclease 3 n=1 Tax=Bacteroides sedimenti TaxID=2136147 RepID=A0ABM8IIE7_9BACE